MSRHRLKLLLLAGSVLVAAAPAAAQQVDSNTLLEVMVRKGVVTRVEADAMIAEAKAKGAAAAPVATAAAVPAGTQVIPYIPQVVRDQLKAELRTELADQASTEGWAKPGEVAEWTKRITISGDIRVRGEGVRFDKPKFTNGLQTGGNYADFPNFGAINSGSAFNQNVGAAGYANPPYLNTTENRDRARIRARLGIAARVDDHVVAEVRIATGSDRSPVSTNQTLGSNGEFGKYSIWLDRADIRLTPVKGVEAVLGRFANPFWTSELLFDDDLNFDGVATSINYPVTDHVGVFANAGAFPIFNTDFNFGSNDAGSFASKDKYLVAGQIGIVVTPFEAVSLKLAGGYFRFEKVQGELSSPCPFNQDVCDTDAMRPAFQQFGNSLKPLRNIVADPSAAPGTSADRQYYGLASKFQILDVHAALDLGFFAAAPVRLEGDYVKNLGFDRAGIAATAINPSSFGPGTTVGTVTKPGAFAGGDIGWQANLIVGQPELTKRGDWKLLAGYRHIESDAVLDAFADSDFHFGGTNAKGYILGGWYAFAKGTSIGARWLSSDAIAGPTYSNDVLQIDLTTKF
ncbi:putative porin [Sphingosinicellaceae bacterium]|nr:putative porin [Sphingosinicellaceae bacterium]